MTQGLLHIVLIIFSPLANSKERTWQTIKLKSVHLNKENCAVGDTYVKIAIIAFLTGIQHANRYVGRVSGDNFRGSSAAYRGVSPREVLLCNMRDSIGCLMGPPASVTNSCRSRLCIFSSPQTLEQVVHQPGQLIPTQHFPLQTCILFFLFPAQYE